MTEFEPRPESVWRDAVIAASAFAVDPVGLGGILVKARVGTVRDCWLSLLRECLPSAMPVRRIPLGISDGRLLGGLDLGETLRAGRPVAERGLLAEADGGVVLLAMAERLDAGTVARLGASMDCREIAVERDGLALRFPSRFGVVAFDESASADENPHPALLDRLALHIHLDGLSGPDASEPTPSPGEIGSARDLLPLVTVSEAILKAICGTALALGVHSMRPSLLAVRTARALAALAGHAEVRTEEAALAARLVLAPRATIAPAAEPSETRQDEPSRVPENERPPEHDANEGSPESDRIDVDRLVDDIVLAAAQASIPARLLADLRLGGASRSRASSSGNVGARQESARRGRPAGVRRGDVKGGARLNLIETLRAAVPWQRLRRGDLTTRRVAVRREDFRIARMKQRTHTTTIFVVDASGSSALNRLAEAKGAIELLLGECYVRRDKVALVAFRGRGAELLLPPTRSLVRAKRCLAKLPAGGGTPLAAGIDAAASLADGVKRQGATPIVVFMTDGQANVARGGKPGRAQAESDARSAAGAMRTAGLATLLVDTSPRAQPFAGRLAIEMGATYLPLPAADAASLSRNVRSVGLQAQPVRRGSP
jgi:magnesium chelatase subunit D